jgi:hypothetical protein
VVRESARAVARSLVTGHWSLILTCGLLSVVGSPLTAQDTLPPPSAALIQSHMRLRGPEGHVCAINFIPTPCPKVRLAFTGDINLGSSFIPNGVPPDTQPSAFAQVDSLLVGDLVIGNFEGALSDTLPAGKCDGAKNCYEFRTPRWMAQRLVDAGFTHMNQANNHATDLGVVGREETTRLLDSLGLTPYGILGAIAFDTLGAGDTTTVVAVIGFTTYPFAYSLLDIARAKVVVDSVAKLADVVIVTFHGGTEGKSATRVGPGMERMGGERRGDLKKFARAVIDAGADAVVGHGPHVLRGIEFYKSRPIAYSLGNFVTWAGFNMTGVNALNGVLQLELQGNGSFTSGRFVPLKQVKWVGAVPDRNRAALALVRRVTRLDFPTTGAVIAADGSFTAPPIPRPAPTRARRAP